MVEKYNFNAVAVRDYYPTYENPGNSLWVYEQIIGLMKFGISSFVISPTPYIPNFIRKYKQFYLYPHHSKAIENYKGTYVVRPPFLKLPSKYFTNLNLYFQKKLILKYSKNFNPKLIHAHFGRNGVASIPLKNKYNIPLITSFYGDDVGINKHAKRLKKLYKELIVCGDLFLALSLDMKNDLINIGFPEEKIIVHHLGIDLSLFNMNNNGSFKEKDKVIICCIGRFHEYKGGQDTILAFSRLTKEFENVELRIIGDGPYIPKMELLCREKNIENKVIFINNFKSKDPRSVVLNEIKNCDIFILTPFMDNSGVKTGTPVVLMEAQAFGKPCISTNYAGIPEVLDFVNSGILVEQRNIDQIYEALKLLCYNEDRRILYGKRGRQYIEQELNQEIQMEKLAQIYHSLINKG